MRALQMVAGGPYLTCQCPTKYRTIALPFCLGADASGHVLYGDEQRLRNCIGVFELLVSHPWPCPGAR
jgi:hypothetical protein